MGRSRAHTRRTPRANPHGVLVMRAGRFGFVQTAEGEYFVPEQMLNGAFDGDLVELSPQRGGGARKGSKRARGAGGASSSADEREGLPVARVVRVLDRAHDVVIGRYEVAEPFGVVVPSDARIPYDIFTRRADNPDIEHGSLVRVRISAFPTRRTAATGVVEEVLGSADSANLGVDAVVARHKFETTFGEAALDEARACVLDEIGALASGYRDIRDRNVFTIDPADARDFDDAISLERLDPAQRAASRGACCRLGVHIADVSHYVRWNSSIDLEARRRATSVYLVDRVIPMLPHELCDDLCSLVPGETRRSLTVDLFLDDEARLLDFDIYPALIRSNVRLSYDDALDLAFSDDEGACADVVLPPDVDREGLRRDLRACSALAKMRAARRAQAGGIDFSMSEAKVRLDEQGDPVEIVLRRKNDATELIEEAMIFANETVAAFLAGSSWPCAYRVHERPAPDALGEVAVVLREFSWCDDGLAAGIVRGDAQAVRRAIELSAGRAEGEMVSSLLLRSMRRALYRPENLGHYGLASTAYCHFASPIRRYPDLVVHRMLKARLRSRSALFDQEVAALPWICEHSSDMEREADEAARESQELKMLQYLERFVGTSFSGVVSGVAAFGLFVKLECTAEGLLPVSALGDEYFAFDPVRHTLTGQDSDRVFRLGQRVAVVLKAVDVSAGKMTFGLAGAPRRR